MAHWTYSHSHCSSSYQSGYSACGPNTAGSYPCGCNCFCGEGGTNGCWTTNPWSGEQYQFSWNPQSAPEGCTGQIQLYTYPGDCPSYAWNDAQNDPECQQECRDYCAQYGDHTVGSLPPQHLGRRRPGTGPYTPGRGRRGQPYTPGRRAYNKGGKTNRSRFSGRTQNNPKGKPRK